MSDVKVELYIKLMDILQEFQLPGGKFDGHGLIAALVNAKRYEALQSRCEAAERDARRYRWLRKENSPIVAGPAAYTPLTFNPIFGDALDAAIDTAIKEAGHE